jgi:AraC-like DNA-binding protein
MKSEQKFERRVFHYREFGHRWLRGIGWSRQTAARRGYIENNPQHVFDFCLVASGRVDFLVNRKLISTSSGDIFITWPLERHGSNHFVLQPSELFWFQISLDTCAPLSGSELATYRRELRLKQPRVFPSTPEIRHAFRLMRDECYTQELLWKERVKHLVLGLLADIVRLRRRSPGSRNVSPEIQYAQTWMRRNLAENYTLAQLASRIGFCGPHFQARFKAETGVAPGLFRTHLRIEQAKHELIGGASVTEIAYGLGFSSSQYFSTSFKRMVGLTPQQYATIGR